MENSEVMELIETILLDRGVPQRIKTTLEDSLHLLGNGDCRHENISHFISILDDASSNPNLSMTARTQIWNVLSALEGAMQQK